MLNRPFIELLRQDTQGLIDEMAQDAIREEEQKLNSEDDILQKYLHSACDMLLSPTATMNCLMEPLLPRVGVTFCLKNPNKFATVLLMLILVNCIVLIKEKKKWKIPFLK